MSVFDALVGQDAAAATLAEAAADAARIVGGEPGLGVMTHAWLFTGPPGSGRSVAARAFAAALQCEHGGDGTCAACHTVLAGTHPDVEVEVPVGLTIGVGQSREMVQRSARAPSLGRWQITLVEDADRMTEQAANAVLKALEEPPPRGVFLLCAPSGEDLLPTIRSRCRVVTLRLPAPEAIASYLEREGVDRPVAAFAARASQGHVGRARRLATDAEAQRRRREVLDLPTQVGTVGGCFIAAENLVAAAREEAALMPVPEEAPAAVKTRNIRDAIDRALLDLAAFYRDVLVRQLEADVTLVHSDVEPRVVQVASRTSPETSVRRIQAVLDARTAIDANVTPLLAVEAMAMALHLG